MDKKSLLGLGMLLVSAVAPSFADAAVAVTTTQLNLRAGPATHYPVVVTMPANAHITTYGCLPDYSWCDVSWGGDHGWVAATYIRILYDTRPVELTVYSAPPAGIRVINFDYGYWQRYYPGRPWFASWSTYAPPPRPRPMLAPPPPGAVVVHRSATACGPHGCGHVAGAYYGPLPPHP